MSEVFISYRQTNDEQRQRVRAFAERLRDAGITVILDQFFDDDNPGGPNDGWPQWSSNRASKTDYILIVGTEPWFQCFDGTQKPGDGLGAACEARVIRQRIYDTAGVNDHIRIVLFEDADAASISIDLRGYQRFHTDRDFEKMVRWLGGRVIVETPRTSIPHNLPSLQPFFGRQEELEKIADALDPESRTWGVLINGPGGMGKTSLAVRAAYDASAEAFDKIVYISLKSRVLDNDGERDLSGFLISGLAELLNEFARELGHDEIVKIPETQRPRRLHEALRGTRTLVVLDNLESLVKRERDIIFTFVDKLPLGCKAILTARGRIGSGGKEIILQELSKEAALATLANLVESNPALAKTSEAERLNLYRETGGNPLLLRWTAGQIGRGSSLTVDHAIGYLRSCPDGNDPLEFIFGDLIENFTEVETWVLCALTYFTLPARVEHISEFTEFSSADTDQALRDLVNRSLVVPSEELRNFTLVALIADFLRKERPEVVAKTGERLESHAYALVVENGYSKHDRFPVLDAAWPMIAAALPCFVAGPNARLQMICDAVRTFLEFTGRWDEWLALSNDAEKLAVSAGDYFNAGWRAHQAGWVQHLRDQYSEVLACADRSEDHWRKAQIGTHEKACLTHLRGTAHKTGKDYRAAVTAFREAVELWLTLGRETKHVALGLNALAEAERLSGDLSAAESDYREALRIARVVNYDEGVAIYTSNLAALALEQEDWASAEVLAREGLSLSEKLGRQNAIALNCRWLAMALAHQGKKEDGLPYARRAVEIFKRLGSSRLASAQRTLTDCEN